MALGWTFGYQQLKRWTLGLVTAHTGDVKEELFCTDDISITAVTKLYHVDQCRREWKIVEDGCIWLGTVNKRRRKKGRCELKYCFTNKNNLQVVGLTSRSEKLILMKLNH